MFIHNKYIRLFLISHQKKNKKRKEKKHSYSEITANVGSIRCDQLPDLLFRVTHQAVSRRKSLGHETFGLPGCLCY